MIRNSLNKDVTKKIACPICGEVGKKVALYTVRSLTKQDFLESIHAGNYFFCAEPDCEVIYYSLSQEVIRKHQIKTRVGVKEKIAPRPVCYCFGHTAEDIRDEIREKGSSTVEKEIMNKIQTGLCHCEDSNPEGRCCLGNVAIAVREAFQLLGLASVEQNLEASSVHVCCKLPATAARQ